MTSEVAKNETRILGMVVECKDKPMKLKRVVGDIYTSAPAYVQGNLHKYVQLTVDLVAPHAKKTKKSGD